MKTYTVVLQARVVPEPGDEEAVETDLAIPVQANGPISAATMLETMLRELIVERCACQDTVRPAAVVGETP